MTPFFTIATITYNSGKWVKYAIESILASSYDNFELLISDDCSSDSTWQIIQSYTDPRIIAWRNETNIGEYPNRNKVLERAKGKYIFYIDGDDILYKHSLQNLYNYLSAFPDAGMVWGALVSEIDFAVLPYQFAPEQITRLTYFTHYTLSTIGLGDTVFNTIQLKAIGGFKYSYTIGDTYIKRKLALTSKVLVIPAGLSFWRRSDNQASKKAMQNFRSSVDMHNINREIIADENFPSGEYNSTIAAKNIKISEVKLLITNTLLAGKVSQFFILWKKLNIKLSDLKYLFEKGVFTYKVINDVSAPLLNDYNLKRAHELETT